MDGPPQGTEFGPSSKNLGNEDEYMECGPCFAGHTFPSDWDDSNNLRQPDAPASDSEASISGGSESASDADTASEAEAVQFLDLVAKDTQSTENDLKGR